MTDPAIKAALEAAACARIAARCGDPVGTRYDLTPEALQEEAAAIAAFLRALPVTGFGYAGTLMVGPHVADTVADLVEAAAREGGG